MESRGMVQADLAVSLGVSQAAVSRWLGGRVPRAGELYRLAKLFGVSMESLLGAEPDVEPTQEEVDTVPVGDVLANRLRAFARQMGWSSVDDLERFLRAAQRLSEALRPGPVALPLADPSSPYLGGPAPEPPLSLGSPGSLGSSGSPPSVPAAPAPSLRAASAQARREAKIRAGVDHVGEGILGAVAGVGPRAKSGRRAPVPPPSGDERAGSASEPAAATPECPPPAET